VFLLMDSYEREHFMRRSLFFIILLCNNSIPDLDTVRNMKNSLKN